MRDLGQALLGGVRDFGASASQFQRGIGLNNGAANQRNAGLANLLLNQSQATQNPLVAALLGFTGASALSNIGRAESQQREREEAAAMARQQRQGDLEERKLGLEERKVDISGGRLDLQREQMQEDMELRRKKLEQDQEKFERNLAFNVERFNKENIRDAQNQAITKVEDPDTGVQRLYKGVEPLNAGLEKGLQWGVDKKGNRIAVPIPELPNQKARQVKDLALSTVDRLLNNEAGVKSVFGAFDQLTPNILSTTRDAETDLNQLRALLTAENLDLMTGVLSETDIKILQNIAAGGIAETASQEGALRAIRELKTTLQGKGTAQDGKTLDLKKKYGLE